MCFCVLIISLLEIKACPVDVYFTIDTSETVALQEPPPGALVESIKVAHLCTTLWLKTIPIVGFSKSNSCVV